VTNLLLNLTDLSSEPLHGQISRQIRARILAHELTDEEPLPSIRVMAREHKVSVITVQRAYEDLEREGLIQSRRGKGFFVSPISQEIKQTMAEDRLAAVLSRLLDQPLAEGLSPQRISEVFRNLVEKRGNQR
jgi:GntR family transcriptional regulator